MTTLTALLAFAVTAWALASIAIYVLSRTALNPELIHESELTFFLKVFFFWPFVTFGRGKND